MGLDLIKESRSDNDVRSFLDHGIHLNAKNDFRFLCQKTGYNMLNNVHLQAVRTADNYNRHLGDFLVLGCDIADKKIAFPSMLIDVEAEKQFVAVVCYNNGNVQDVLVFSVGEFKKPGMFSIFKNLKKEGMFSVAISNADNKNLKQYSFGYVLNKL